MNLNKVNSTIMNSVHLAMNSAQVQNLITDIQAKSRLVKYAKDQIVYQENEICDGLYIIMQGQFSVPRAHPPAELSKRTLLGLQHFYHCLLSRMHQPVFHDMHQPVFRYMHQPVFRYIFSPTPISDHCQISFAELSVLFFCYEDETMGGRGIRQLLRRMKQFYPSKNSECSRKPSF